MASVLPSIIDRYRNHKNGRRKFTGHVLLFDSSKSEKPIVIATVYGDTLAEMRKRKRIVCQAMKETIAEQSTPKRKAARHAR